MFDFSASYIIIIIVAILLSVIKVEVISGAFFSKKDYTVEESELIARKESAA